MKRVRALMRGGLIFILIALLMGLMVWAGVNKDKKQVISPLVGDIDKSGRVDGFDLGRFGVAHGTREGDPLWNPRLDLNNNGVLDGKDLEIIHKNFGNTAKK